MKNIIAIFSKNLKDKRKKCNLTQKELANELAYSEKAVSKWETGLALPPSSLLPKLALILNTSIDELMTQDGEVKYYLGIDGGGTKTEFALADTSGRILERCVLGASNPNVIGMDGTEDILRKGIMQICASTPIGSTSVYAGIAGAGVADNGEKIKLFLQKFGFAHSECGSDAMNPISAGLMDEDGIAIILGTGSSLYAKINGEICHRGGYGYLLDDPASGFSIGRDALISALNAEVGVGESTILTELIKEKCNVKAVSEAIGDFYKNGHKYISSLAPIVFSAYREGDLIAEEILRQNLNKLSVFIKNLGRKFPSDTTVPVVLCGGLTAMSDTIIPMLTECLKDDGREYNVYVCQAPLVYGALYLAGLR